MDDLQKDIPPQVEDMSTLYKWILQTAYNHGFPVILLLLFAYFQQQQINELSVKVERCQEDRIIELKQNKIHNGQKEQIQPQEKGF